MQSSKSRSPTTLQRAASRVKETNTSHVHRNCVPQRPCLPSPASHRIALHQRLHRYQHQHQQLRECTLSRTPPTTPIHPLRLTLSAGWPLRIRTAGSPW